MRFHRRVVLSLVAISILLSLHIPQSHALNSELSPLVSAIPDVPPNSEKDKVKIATKHFNKRHSAAVGTHTHPHNNHVKKKLGSIRDIDIKHFYGGRSQEFTAITMNLTSAGTTLSTMQSSKQPLSPASAAKTPTPISMTSSSLLSSDVASSLSTNTEVLTTAIVESASGMAASVLKEADKIVEKSIRKLHETIIHSLEGSDDDPLPPKPKPKPVPLPPSSGADANPIITSSDVVEDKIYSNDLVPYQHFGHYVLSVNNHLFVSTAIPSSLKDNKIYVFSLNVSFASPSADGDSSSEQSIDGDSSQMESNDPAVEEILPVENRRHRNLKSTPRISDDRTLESFASPLSSVSSMSSLQNVSIARKLLQSLSSDTGNNYDGFGLSMSSNGEWVVVGAPYDDTKGYLSGKTYLFRYHSESGLYDANVAQPHLLSSTAFPMGTMYGSSVANAASYIAIGAPGESVSQRLFAGAVHVYQFNAVNGIWSLMTVLYDDDASSSNYERFGTTVIMLDDDGDDAVSESPTLSVSLIVSAIGKNNAEGSSDTGAVFIYYSTKDDGTVESSSKSSWKLQQTLSPSTLQSRAYFGYSMAFTNEFGAIAAYSEDNSGVVYLYRSQSASPSPSSHSSSTLRSLQNSEVNQLSSSSTNRQWILQQVFYPSDAGQGMDNQFGSSLAIRQSVRYDVDTSSSLSSSTYCVRRRHVLVVGAHGDSSLNTDAGAVYLFASDESQQCSTSLSSVPESNVNGDDNIDSSISTASKKTKKDTKSNGDWQVIAKFTCEDHQQFNAYGRSVQMMHFTGTVTSDDAATTTSSSENVGVVSSVETTILFVGAELANSPQVNNSGVVYLEQNTLTYLLEEYTIQEESNKHGDASSTFWQRFQALFYSSAGYVTMAFLPSALFVVCVMFHFHQKHQIEKKKLPLSDNSVEMLGLDNKKDENDVEASTSGSQQLIPTCNTEDDGDHSNSHRIPLTDGIASSSSDLSNNDQKGIFEKLRHVFNVSTILSKVGSTSHHVRSVSNISSLSSASGSIPSAYKQVNKSEHDEREDERGEEFEGGFYDHEEGHGFLEEMENAQDANSFSSKKRLFEQSSSHKRRGSHGSNNGLEIEIDIPSDEFMMSQGNSMRGDGMISQDDNVSPSNSHPGASMDEIYPNNEQLLSPLMMHNLMHQHNSDGVPFSDQWVKSSSIKSPQQVFADYRFVPTQGPTSEAGGGGVLSTTALHPGGVVPSFGGDQLQKSETESDSHSLSSSDTKHSHHGHGSTLSKVKKLLQKFSHPHGDGKGSTSHKKRRSFSSTGSDLVFNPLPLENVEEGAEDDAMIHEYRSKSAIRLSGVNHVPDDDEDDDQHGKSLQSSLTL